MQSRRRMACGCVSHSPEIMEDCTTLVALRSEADDLPCPSEWTQVGDEAFQVRRPFHHPCVLQIGRDPERERQESLRRVPPLLQAKTKELFQQIEDSGRFPRR